MGHKGRLPPPPTTAINHINQSTPAIRDFLDTVYIINYTIITIIILLFVFDLVLVTLPTKQRSELRPPKLNSFLYLIANVVSSFIEIL